MKKQLLDFFKDKKVLILGFGREGRSTLELIKGFGCAKITIADKNAVDAADGFAAVTGDNYLSELEGDYDVIMKSPGIALFDVPERIKAKITGQTDLLLRFCENTVIGITGTKGKSTTSSLICHILNKCGFDARLIGNIGVPPLAEIDSFKPETVIICEMSCHQLEYVKASPDIAVLLNVYEEHLDHYKDFAAYKYAKENIFRFLGENGTLIYNTDCFSDEISALPCEKLSAGLDENADICADMDGISVCGVRIPAELIKTRLAGHHNLYNIAVALACAVQVGCELDSALEAVADFSGLEHRLELVRTVDGVKYVNDSISTIPAAAISAVNAFSGADTLIIGGMDRGIDYKALIDFLNDGAVANVICLKDSGYRIAKGLDGTKMNVYLAQDLPDAVSYAAKVTKLCCILSPAAASYGFYKNFEERGQHFKELVKAL